MIDKVLYLNNDRVYLIVKYFYIGYLNWNKLCLGELLSIFYIVIWIYNLKLKFYRINIKYT